MTTKGDAWQPLARSRWLAGLFVLGSWSTGAASAQGTGIEVGGRIGYGGPLGNASGPGEAVSDAIEGQVPLMLDLGYRVLPNLSGFELFNLQAGLDIEATDHFYLGPFVSLSFAQFDSTAIECSEPAGVDFCDGSVERDIADKAVHEWLMFGIRGAYVP